MKHISMIAAVAALRFMADKPTDKKGNAAPVAPVEPVNTIQNAPPSNLPPSVEAQLSGALPPVEELHEEPAPEPANRFMRLFEAIHFEPSDNMKVNTNERDGSQSVKMASVILTFKGGFAGIPGTIYARRGKGQTKVTADFSFIGTTNRQGVIKPLDALAGTELAEFKQYVTDEYIGWREKQPKAAPGVKARPTATGAVLSDAGNLFGE